MRPMCPVLVLALALSLLLTVVGSSEFLQYPNVFIIGAMKCGTTTLYQLLSDNPHICSDGEKEVRVRRGEEEALVPRNGGPSNFIPVAYPNLPPPHLRNTTSTRTGTSTTLRAPSRSTWMSSSRARRTS